MMSDPTYSRMVEILIAAVKRGLLVDEVIEVFRMGEPYRSTFKKALWVYGRLLPKDLIIK